MANLFAYVTLMCDDIMKAVAGYLPVKKNGVIAGYRRLAVRNEQYPGLVKAPGGSVAGVVYFDISERGWQRLDSFEGDMYSRENVEIMVEGATLVSCTYVVKENFHHLLSDSDWSFQRFMDQGKGKFEDGYSGYDELK